ncbi:putative LacI-family transcriptional regulator [Actinoplanes missouriensis 431]|uniref:Putative LacI-family transcriptional regulator n=1 Tax=Actinoplanes missouriensis (strain ATCC 14538 / DSM 43046 / CBS 188.64 / JCM 3121 / NBRC 102363 / NCIMB 12654 / NRRL B-3342 / UNCC 431) TaxID=512565 RepID=I0H7V7_ACTM4|nr:LacI family DNA-binding transcriptional regulator [Actinoplanes missouriensis]BAL89094.1 putative LacI-family transcriptional regulator [Actinoplanes missouriensis 431]
MQSHRLPTLEDVARVAGVSRATVSRVINGIRNVDPELHRQVWTAVDQTGYVPNRLARSLVTRRTGTVALVVSDSETHDDDPFMSRFFSDPYFGRVVGGLMSVLRPAGVQLALQMVGADGHKRLVGDLRNGQADGAVVLSLPARDPLPRLLAEAGIPAVLIGRPAEPVPVSYVDLDNSAGAELAAARLADRGCRRPALITGPPEVPASADRISGFRRAMARHGHAWVPSAAGNLTQESGSAAMRTLLADHPGTDGVFVANDLMALGALLVLRDAGRRVPDDVAVVGFDDSSAALAARPALTTVRHPLEDMSAEAARLLLTSIDDPSARVTSVIYEPTLIPRHSA